MFDAGAVADVHLRSVGPRILNADAGPPRPAWRETRRKADGVLRWFHRNLESEEPRIECEGHDRCNRDPATVRVAVINQDIAIGRASSAHQPNKRIIDRRRISPNGLEGLE